MFWFLLTLLLMHFSSLDMSRLWLTQADWVPTESHRHRSRSQLSVSGAGAWSQLTTLPLDMHGNNIGKHFPQQNHVLDKPTWNTLLVTQTNSNLYLLSLNILTCLFTEVIYKNLKIKTCPQTMCPMDVVHNMKLCTYVVGNTWYEQI